MLNFVFGKNPTDLFELRCRRQEKTNRSSEYGTEVIIFLNAAPLLFCSRHSIFCLQGTLTYIPFLFLCSPLFP